jgi:hypothetical protein
MRTILSLAALLAAGPLGAAPLPMGEDYQKKADEAPWEWSDDRATAADCAKRLQGDYTAEVEARDKFGGVVIRIVKDGRVVHFFEGHQRTVFAVRHDVLYHAVFGRASTGCAVVACDLRTGKQLWKARLKGLGPIAHKDYRNAVNLDLEKYAVCVRGHECLGRYIEYVDLRTSATVGHKVYSGEE